MQVKEIVPSSREKKSSTDFPTRHVEALNLDRSLLIYDGNCNICNKLVDWVSNKLPDSFEPIKSQSLIPEEYGLKQKDFDNYVWLIMPDRKKIKGSMAAARVLRAMGSGWVVLGTLISIPPFSFVAFAVYWLFSKNRKRLGSLCAIK
mgnify:FL=1|tara:strand:+ start:124 stop:564 length:441 start_codon:yes stop_codon:yes gene_type:complete